MGAGKCLTKLTAESLSAVLQVQHHSTAVTIRLIFESHVTARVRFRNACSMACPFQIKVSKSCARFLKSNTAELEL